MNKKYDVIVLTEDRYENPTTIDAYSRNVVLEDAILVNALMTQGLNVGRFSWSNPNVNWDEVTSVIFRSTWDYFDRFGEFKIWLDKVQDKVVMFNDAKLISWNQDKSYLNDLSQKGISIAPTAFIAKGESKTLKEITSTLAYNKYILKPNISGGSRHTYKLDDSTVSNHEEIFSDLIQQEDFMIQEFQENILTQGEISLIIIDGKFTHAVLKQGVNGDFRIQDDFGGTVQIHKPKRDEIAFAEQCVKAIDGTTLYCRVDIMRDNTGELILMELEMIEPELWFRNCPEAAMRLAEAVKRSL